MASSAQLPMKVKIADVVSEASSATIDGDASEMDSARRLAITSRKSSIALSEIDMYDKPIAERIDWLRGLARENSLVYSSPGSYLERDRYIARHPSRLLVLSCMDGRLNFSLATRTPRGIIRTFRNLGGRFDLGWPHLCDTVAAAVDKAVKKGRRVLALVTYHFSKGDYHRGCAGFHYDTAAAREHTRQIKDQFEVLFGKGHQTVYPLIIGFETDEDALILHASDGKELKVAEMTDSDRDHLRNTLDIMFPDMPDEMRNDLMPLILGNMRHVESMKKIQRELDIEHREWVLAIGRGFDWITLPNTALIVGPYSPDLDGPIRIAAKIIQSNMNAGRIPSDGFLLLACSAYEDPGVDRAKAEIKAKFIGEFAQKVIRESFPDLAEKMTCVTVILDWRSRALENVQSEEKHLSIW